MYPAYRLFDNFFPQPTIVVVSEERLREAERQYNLERLKLVDEKLSELREYRQSLAKQLAPAEKTGKDLDKLDEATCDV
tara:strand:- start:1501 stop:1737 length:237 start_codon:yes stop_codon:yes gene_type:complete